MREQDRAGREVRTDVLQLTSGLALWPGELWSTGDAAERCGPETCLGPVTRCGGPGLKVRTQAQRAVLRRKVWLLLQHLQQPRPDGRTGPTREGGWRPTAAP